MTGNAIPVGVIPRWGKEALGKQRAPQRKHRPDMQGRVAVSTSMGVELEIKPFNQGVYVGQPLSLGLYGKGF